MPTPNAWPNSLPDCHAKLDRALEAVRKRDEQIATLNTRLENAIAHFRKLNQRAEAAETEAEVANVQLKALALALQHRDIPEDWPVTDRTRDTADQLRAWQGTCRRITVFEALMREINDMFEPGSMRMLPNVRADDSAWDAIVAEVREQLGMYG